MGQKLVKIFEFAAANGGTATQMRVAMKTGVSVTKAGTEPDSPELIAKLRAAVKEITGKDAPAV